MTQSSQNQGITVLHALNHDQLLAFADALSALARAADLLQVAAMDCSNSGLTALFNDLTEEADRLAYMRSEMAEAEAERNSKI